MGRMVFNGLMQIRMALVLSLGLLYESLITHQGQPPPSQGPQTPKSCPRKTAMQANDDRTAAKNSLEMRKLVGWNPRES